MTDCWYRLPDHATKSDGVRNTNSIEMTIDTQFKLPQNVELKCLQNSFPIVFPTSQGFVSL